MEQTVHLFVGTGLRETAAGVAEHILHYQPGMIPDYAHFLLREETSDGWAMTALETVEGDEEATSVRWCEQRQILKSDSEESRFWADYYAHTLTVQRAAHSSTLHIFLYVPVNKDVAADYPALLAPLLHQLHQQFKLSVVALMPDLSPLWGEEIESSSEASREHLQRLLQAKQDHAEVFHRIFLMQNCSEDGISLDLDIPSVTKVLGEFASAVTECYDALFPLSEENDPVELTAFGLSAIWFDQFYLREYLRCRNILAVLDRENVTQTEVDVNAASHIARQRLDGKLTIFEDFYHRKVNPLLKQGLGKNDIVATLKSEIDRLWADLKADLLTFFHDGTLSLPEKQAILAQLLGVDDALLVNYQFDKEMPMLEEMTYPPLRFFANEVNEVLQHNPSSPLAKELKPLLVTHNKDEKGKEKEKEKEKKEEESETGSQVVLPMEKLKDLRLQIHDTTSYIRKKEEELATLGVMSAPAQNDGLKRFISNGYRFDGTIFKLQDEQEELPLTDYYRPQNQIAENVDLRPFFTPVKHQGDIGACTVYSLVSIYEYILKKSKSQSTDLSERFVFHNICATHEQMEDSGSTMSEALTTLQRDGVCAERLCPDIKHFADSPSLEAFQDAQTHKVHTAKRVETKREAFQSALTEGYPVAITLKIFDSFAPTQGGYIPYPSDEEISSGDFGWHAMVITGYIAKHELYIVRNSWGTEFGENGYCYIPYKYLESPDLNRNCCIITQINDGEEVRFAEDTHLGVVSNLGEISDRLKAAVITAEVEKEKNNLKKSEQRFGRLRTYFEHLVQTFCKPAFRNQLLSENYNRLDDEYQGFDTEYKQLFATRPVELKAHKRQTIKNIIITSIALALLLVSLGLYIYLREFKSVYTYINLAFIVIDVLYLAIYPVVRMREYREMDEDFQLQLSELERKKAQNLEQREVMDVRIHYAGLLLDTLSQGIAGVRNLYDDMRGFLTKLNGWHLEETERLNALSPDSPPFVTLLENSWLDRYFSDQKEFLTQDLQLSPFITRYSENQKDFDECKREIRRLVQEKLRQNVPQFNACRFLTKIETYPFVDPAKHSDELFQQMTQWSRPFLHFAVTNLETRHDRESYVFLNMPTSQDESAGKAVLRRAFQQCPSIVTAAAPHKVSMLQKQNITLEDVLF